MCCLSSRYMDDPRILPNTGVRLFELCQTILREDMSGKTTMPVVQTLFNLAVFAEGLSKPSSSLVLLSKAST